MKLSELDRSKTYRVYHYSYFHCGRQLTEGDSLFPLYAWLSPEEREVCKRQGNFPRARCPMCGEMIPPRRFLRGKLFYLPADEDYTAGWAFQPDGADYVLTTYE